MRIEKHNNQYVDCTNKHRKRGVYCEYDIVWIHLKQKRFSERRFIKLRSRVDGHFRVLKKINDNAYKIELSSHYNVSATFNVADLSSFIRNSCFEAESMRSSIQEREDDTTSTWGCMIC